MPSSPFYESQRRQPSIPTAQARLQGLQGDPRRLANANAVHKSPCKISVGQAARRLALMGIRNQTITILSPFRSAALHQNANPLPINNSLPLELNEKTPDGLCPSYPHKGRMIAFATAVRSGPSALRGPRD